MLCLPCPAGCARSEKLEGGLIVRPGYGVSSHVAAQQRPLRDVGGARSLFRCPVAAWLASAKLGGYAAQVRKTLSWPRSWANFSL